jgi:uncharacterized protein YjlB
MDQPETLQLEDGGAVPNSRLPVLVYHGVADARSPESCKAMFARNRWLGAWENGIFPYHHYHATVHEVLGIVSGSATVMLGGDGGPTVEVGAGDVVVLPAGTGHCKVGSTGDLLVVGAYPEGMPVDLHQDDPADREAAVASIADVPLPHADPVHGPDGPLRALWSPTRA